MKKILIVFLISCGLPETDRFPTKDKFLGACYISQYADCVNITGTLPNVSKVSVSAAGYLCADVFGGSFALGLKCNQYGSAGSCDLPSHDSVHYNYVFYSTAMNELGEEQAAWTPDRVARVCAASYGTLSGP